MGVDYSGRHAKETGSSSLSTGGGLAGGHLSPFRAFRGGIDYRALREAVTIAQVLEFVDWKPTARSGDQMRGPCPIHKSTNERSRSFSVSVGTNVYQCFSCGGKGNQLDLWVAISGLSIYEAALDLAHRLQIDADRIEKRNTS
jgi:DNA primase